MTFHNRNFNPFSTKPAKTSHFSILVCLTPEYFTLSNTTILLTLYSRYPVTSPKRQLAHVKLAYVFNDLAHVGEPVEEVGEFDLGELGFTLLLKPYN